MNPNVRHCFSLWKRFQTHLITSNFRNYGSAAAPLKNYYKTLGVRQSATTQEIKEAYRALSKKYHPDIAGDSPETRSKFVEINEAISVLGNEASRKEYDFQRKLNSFSIIESGYKMEYTKPKSSDPVLIAAYEEEMRRRWNERLLEWMKGQGEYELERGHHVKPLPSFMSYSYVSTEDAKIRYLCIFGLLLFIASLIYIYKDIKAASRNKTRRTKPSAEQATEM